MTKQTCEACEDAHTFGDDIHNEHTCGACYYEAKGLPYKKMKHICSQCIKQDEKPKPPYEMSYCDRCGIYKLCADVENKIDIIKDIGSLFGNFK